MKVNTWLPIFSGFYGTIWESDSVEEMELENINEDRREKHLPPVEYDDVEFDYTGYYESVSKSVAGDIFLKLIDLGLIRAGLFQKLTSPREYNFVNDSIHVRFVIDDKNVRTIANYLKAHDKEFAKYLLDHYTSYDGFMSNYSNDVDEWLEDIQSTVTHEHKLGAVLDFILLNEEGPEYEMSLYENTEVFLEAKVKEVA